MPYNPTLGQVHVDTPIPGFAEGYLNDRGGFVAMRAAPILLVDKVSDKYFKYSKEDFLRISAGRRAPGDAAPLAGYGMSTASFSCERDAVAFKLPDPIRNYSDVPLRPERDAAAFCAEQLMMRADQRFQSEFFATGIWGTDWDGVTGTPSTNEFKRFDESAADPVDTVFAAKEDVRLGTGLEPNVLIVGAEVHNALRTSDAILDRIRYTERGVVTAELLRNLFELDEYIVAKSFHNSADKGQTASYSSILGGKSALLLYRNPNPGPMSASALMTFALRQYSGDMYIKSKMYRDEKHESDMYESEIWYDTKLVASDLGAFLENAVS